jgi:hypothetical protein
MLCLFRMLLASKWPASAHVGIPFLGFVIKYKSPVATGEKYAQCKHSK